MKSVCLYFQIHQPLRLKKYRFFNMGKDVMYLDDYLNRSIMQRAADNCYHPMNEMLLKCIKESNGKFKVSFSISGLAIEQMKLFEPELLDSFKALAATGSVEFMAETQSHTLSSVLSKEEFFAEVKTHAALIEKEFGVKPKSFANTELIYSDAIGEMVAELGYDSMVTEGAKHILGWKSPDFVYVNAINPRLKLLMRNSRLSDDLRYRFSDRTWDQWPLTADKYVEWVEDGDGEVCNIYLDYETFGEYQNCDSGVFSFFEHFVKGVIANKKLEFDVPSNVTATHHPVAVLHVPYPISWTDEEKDVTAWIGNDLQNEATSKLYSLRDDVIKLNDPDINKVWEFLKTSNHFYYMSTKWFTDNSTSNVNPYDSPYEAFINYMNVLSDFIRNVKIKVKALE